MLQDPCSWSVAGCKRVLSRVSATAASSPNQRRGTQRPPVDPQPTSHACRGHSPQCPEESHPPTGTPAANCGWQPSLGRLSVTQPHCCPVRWPQIGHLTVKSLGFPVCRIGTAPASGGCGRDLGNCVKGWLQQSRKISFQIDVTVTLNQGGKGKGSGQGTPLSACPLLGSPIRSPPHPHLSSQPDIQVDPTTGL